DWDPSSKCLPFVLKLFMAGMSSTSRVESYNAKLKRLIFNSNTTMLELANKLTECVLEEDKKTEYALFCASVPKAALVAIADKSFLVAQKFGIEQSVTMGWNGSVPYLNALNQGAVYEMKDINRKTIDERKARAALMVAVRRHDYNFISILDKYLEDCRELSSNSDSDVDSNSTSNSESEDSTEKRRLDPKELMNLQKHKGKGRPKGTNRIRRANEPPKKAKHKLHYKICG
ncbi:2118_t:CDS:2, partial [Racocetra fulgida]